MFRFMSLSVSACFVLAFLFGPLLVVSASGTQEQQPSWPAAAGSLQQSLVDELSGDFTTEWDMPLVHAWLPAQVARRVARVAEAAAVAAATAALGADATNSAMPTSSPSAAGDVAASEEDAATVQWLPIDRRMLYNGTLSWRHADDSSAEAKIPEEQKEQAVGGAEEDVAVLLWNGVSPDRSASVEFPLAAVGAKAADLPLALFFPLLSREQLQATLFDGRVAPPDMKKASQAVRASAVARGEAVTGEGLEGNAHIRSALQWLTRLIRSTSPSLAAPPAPLTPAAEDVPVDEVASETAAGTGKDSVNSEAAAAAAAPPVVPSYGYVLCRRTVRSVPTPPHTTRQGNYFTTHRRVAPSDGETAEGSEVHATQIAVYAGYIFALPAEEESAKAVASLEPTTAAEELCGASSSNAAEAKGGVPLRITAVGTADGAVEPTAAAASIGAAGGSKGWALDSVTFEFGPLPHERAWAAAAEASGAAPRLPVAGPTVAANTLYKAATTVASGEEAVAQQPQARRQLLAAHPLLAPNRRLLAKAVVTASGKQHTPASVAALVKGASLLPGHRITWRRVHRIRRSGVLGVFASFWDQYWRSALLACGFIFFRFYAGYRYAAKRNALTQNIITESTATQAQMKGHTQAPRAHLSK